MADETKRTGDWWEVDPQTAAVKVVGVTFDNRQATIARLMPGQGVTLQREPDNRYDPNAVAVVTLDGAPAGYLPKVLAACLAPQMDAGTWRPAAMVSSITGHGLGSLGLVIKVTPSLPAEAFTL